MTEIVSTGTKTIGYATVAVALAAAIVLSSIYYVSTSTTSVTSTGSQTNSQIPDQSVLVVQLTDPPQVPAGTSSLNLTYSAVNLLVSEPSYNGQVTINSISVTQPGDSSTLDLSHLQNLSVTIASIILPTGSIIYTIGFTVESIALDLNGSIYHVTLATGGDSLDATLVHPADLNGSAAALLDLSPVVVDTPTGYQLIPSMVGVLKPQSEFTPGDANLGTTSQITQKDKLELDQARGESSRLSGW